MYINYLVNKLPNWAVVVAERLLPTPEIRGSNPDMGNISNVFICQLLSRKDENKEKEAGNGPFKKNKLPNLLLWFDKIIKLGGQL